MRNKTALSLATWSILAIACHSAMGAEFCLVRDGKPAATIVTAPKPSQSAAFAAAELQEHVEKITGAKLPIVADDAKVEGPRILVGSSDATTKLATPDPKLQSQEYLIRFLPDALVLVGKDDPAPGPAGAPEWSKEQGTSYAVHDFLERFCGVRWFAPGDIGLVCPTQSTLMVKGEDIRRKPAFEFRSGAPYPPGPIAKELWDHPSQDQWKLYWARQRLGGRPYSCNHSFTGFYDRFLEKDKAPAGIFESSHPEWFAKGHPGRPPQMCYTNDEFIKQVVKDARDYFDGKGAKYRAMANGDYFGLVPMDEEKWCLCPTCQAELDQSQKHSRHFTNGYASDYVFNFVNKVAREVKKTHPDKYLSIIAYSHYGYYPQHTAVEPNVSVQLCLHVRNWWAPSMERNDMRFYTDWTTKEKGRPLYLWLYYCFPEEMGIFFGEQWNCFPGCQAHLSARQIKMFARDGIRGVFLNGIGEHVDAYITFRLFDDPTLDIDRLIDDYFASYYGPAGEPLKKMYLRMEEIYTTPANYPEAVQKEDQHWHQSQAIAWGSLGTEARMAELGKFVEAAKAAGGTDVQRKRVALFEKAVWQYMQEGRRQFVAKQAAKAKK